MLEQRTSDGLTYLASPLLEAAGVPHGFSTRLGGVSEEVFASLNLGNPGGSAVRDPDANIAENYRRLMAATHLLGRTICRVHQVHSAGVVVVREAATHDPTSEADALVTADAGVALSIRTADCVPLLLATPDGRWVSAVHAGWRGVIAGLLPAAIRLVCAGSPGCRQNLLLAIGPHIGGEAFEVGPEVTAEFRRVFGDEAPITRTVGQKSYIDLGEALAIQARREGLSAAGIERTDLCTYRDADLFFSHRRDNGLTGRMAAVIGPRPQARAGLTAG